MSRFLKTSDQLSALDNYRFHVTIQVQINWTLFGILWWVASVRPSGLGLAPKRVFATRFSPDARSMIQAESLNSGIRVLLSTIKFRLQKGKSTTRSWVDLAADRSPARSKSLVPALNSVYLSGVDDMDLLALPWTPWVPPSQGGGVRSRYLMGTAFCRLNLRPSVREIGFPPKRCEVPSSCVYIWFTTQTTWSSIKYK